MMPTSIFIREAPGQGPSLWVRQGTFVRKNPKMIFLEGIAAAARLFCDCGSDREGFGGQQ